MNDISMISLLASASFGVKIILVILLFMSILSWGIIIKKYITIKKEARTLEELSTTFWKHDNVMEIYKSIKNKKYGFMDEPLKSSIKFFYTTRKENPKTPPSLINEIVSGNFQVAVQKKERMLLKQISTLGTISSTAPYVGLLGTVYGILVAFWGLGWENGASIAAIAPSIAEALIATGMGLFVAIPALVAYNNLTHKIENIRKECSDIEDETINIINKSFVKKTSGNKNGQQIQN